MTSYPRIDNPCIRQDGLNFTFKVEQGTNLDNCLLFMQPHMTNANLKMWAPNHFVPCVRSIHKTTPAKKNTTVQPGSKRSAQDFFLNCKKKKLWLRAQQSRRRKILLAKKKEVKRPKL